MRVLPDRVCFRQRTSGRGKPLPAQGRHSEFRSDCAPDNDPPVFVQNKRKPGGNRPAGLNSVEFSGRLLLPRSVPDNLQEFSGNEAELPILFATLSLGCALGRNGQCTFY